MKNKYCTRSHISEAQVRPILHFFTHDFDSYATAEIVGIPRQSIQKYFERIRKRVPEWDAAEKPSSGEVGVDESYFGSRRVGGKRGRGSGKEYWYWVF